MAAYDFRCSACRCTFEVVRPMGASSDETCPECGAIAKKVFTPVGVSFKGTGFHNTDYRPKPKDESSSEPKPECPAKSEGSTTCSSCPVAG